MTGSSSLSAAWQELTYASVAAFAGPIANQPANETTNHFGGIAFNQTPAVGGGVDRQGLDW